MIVLVIVLVITHQSTLALPILNTRYKDSPHFQDPVWLEKKYDKKIQEIKLIYFRIFLQC